MFAKNMLEPRFREDVFTFPTTTTKTRDQFNEAILLPRSVGANNGNGDNGGGLAPALTAVKVNPYQHKLLTQAGGMPSLDEDVAGTAAVTQPIVAMGSFAPRFDLTQAATRISTNRSAFTLQPDLKLWNGSRISRINRYLKVVESEDVYQHSTASRFNAQGMHQIGLFGNARYAETAVLLAEDQTDLCSRSLSAPDAWTLAGPVCPTVEGPFLVLRGNSHLSHGLEAKAKGSYLVEWQGWVKTAQSVSVALESSAGGVIVQKTVTMVPGLGKYQIDLEVPPSFTPPSVNTTRIFLGAQPAFPASVKLKYLRVYPKQAEALTYLYDSRGDMVQTVDVTNVSTYFEYDLLGKLVAIRNDDGVILSAGSREQTNK
jgi:YD repeat-containing protein